MNEKCINCKYWVKEGAFIDEQTYEPDLLVLVGMCKLREKHTFEYFKCEQFEVRENE